MEQPATGTFMNPSHQKRLPKKGFISKQCNNQPYWGDPTERKEKKTVQFLILKMFSFLIRENLENTKRRNKRKNPL